MRKYLLESIQKTQINLRLEKSCDLETQKDWILNFIRYIDVFMIETPDEKDTITFYCDILFILVICLSGMECFLPKKELLIASPDIRKRLFPQAICILIDRQIWKSITRQVCVNLFFLSYKYFTDITKIYTFS